MSNQPTYEDLAQRVFELENRELEHRQIKEELRMSEDKFRQLFDNSPVGKSITHVSGEMQANKAFYKMIGYAPKEVHTLKWQDITHPDDIALSQKIVDAIVSGQKNYARFTKRYIHKKGNVVWADVSTRLRKDKDGRPLYLITAITDITERRRAEKALQKSESHLRSLLDALPDLVWLKDTDGVYLSCNARFEKFFGAKEKEIIGKTDYDFVNKALADFFRSYDKAVIRKGVPSVNEEEITFAEDGHHEILETVKTPIFSKNGQISGVLGIGRDITKRKKTEAALHESESRYHELFNKIKSGVAIYEVIDQGKDFIFKDFNRAGERLDGDQRDALVGKSIFDVRPGIERFGLLDVFRRVWKTGIPEEFPAKIYKDNRLKKWYENFVYRLPTGEIVAVFDDVTEQKRADKKLQESEGRLKFLSEVTLEGILIHDNGIVVDANPSFAKLMGYRSTDEIIGQMIMTRHFTPKSLKEIQERLSSGDEGTHEAVGIKCDGTHFPVEIIAKNMMYHGKQINAVTARDITERKCAEQELRWNLRRNELLSEIAARLLQSNDPQNLVEDICGKVMQFLDCQVFFNFLKAPHMDKLHLVACSGIPEHHRAELEWLDFGSAICGAVALTRTHMVCENILNTSDPLTERIKSFGVQAYCCHPVMIGDHLFGTLSFGRRSNPRFQTEEIEVMKSVTDLVAIAVNRIETEKTKKHLEDQLRQAQKAESIGNLAGGIAHDFNNILFPIIGLSEMLMDDLPPNSPEHENAVEIHSAGRRGSALIKQILAFSRQSEQKMVPIRIQHLLKEVMKLTRSTIPSNIDITQDIQSDCSLVQANPTQIHQIVMNLITNAYHAVEPESGRIHVRLAEVDIGFEQLPGRKLLPGKYVMLSVSDTGTGIEPAVVSKIFEPYFTTKPQNKGTGLGLSVVYGIVKNHHGEINVHSEPGKGTTFIVYLPVMSKGASAVPTKGKEKFLTGHERILVVDDEPTVARMEKQMLERLGYKVSMYVSSLEALEVFKAGPDAFDLVISDMAMPDMTGDRLALKLIESRPDIPIIICTGFSERLNQKRAERIGIKGFLMKPIVRAEMARMVRKVLD